MIKFDNLSDGPNPNGDYNSRSKTSSVKSKSMGRLYNPYDGVVLSIYNKKCGGYILIQHNINNDTYYSEFCNVDKVTVSKNDFVKKGRVIGYFLNDTDSIEYTLYTSKQTEINPAPFFRGFNILNNQTTKSEPKQTERTYKKTNKKKSKSHSDNDDKYEKPKYREGNDNSVLLGLVLSPFDFISKKTKKLAKNTGKELKKSAKGIFDFSTTKKDNDDDSENLNEEIQKIKKLL